MLEKGGKCRNCTVCPFWHAVARIYFLKIVWIIPRNPSLILTFCRRDLSHAILHLRCLVQYFSVCWGQCVHVVYMMQGKTGAREGTNMTGTESLYYRYTQTHTTRGALFDKGLMTTKRILQYKSWWNVCVSSIEQMVLLIWTLLLCCHWFMMVLAKQKDAMSWCVCVCAHTCTVSSVFLHVCVFVTCVCVCHLEFS